MLVLVTLAVIDYGLYRVLQPQDYGGEGLIAGTAGDLGRIVLHFDLGDACMFYGCPAISEIWLRSWAADLYLLAGGLIIGVTAGVGGAVWCATRPRSLPARVLESAATLFYVMPVYLVGFSALLLFEPSFGAFPMPFFFHPIDYDLGGGDRGGHQHARGPRAGADRPADPEHGPPARLRRLSPSASAATWR